jgi:tetratricopeptide (TPR) repeat protein
MNATPPFAASAPLSAIDESKLRRTLRRAESQREAGLRGAAILSLESALQMQPDSVQILLDLAELHLHEEQHNRAREYAMRALEGRLESPKLALQLVKVLSSLSESGLILQIAEQLQPPMWDSAKSLAQMAQELSVNGGLGPARRFAQAAVARDPRHPPSLAIRAAVDVFHGDLESAASHAERCLSYLPTDSGSHWLLSRLRLPHAEQRIERIEKAIALGPKAEDLTNLGYALHNELHDARQYERAWEALELACRAKRSTLDYSTERAAELFGLLGEWGAEEIRRDDGYRGGPAIPVFVIGQHRSGTTLAERILSGHSRVSQGGETYDIRAALRRASGLHFRSEVDARVIGMRDRIDYRALGEGYARGIAWRAAGKPFVTDKLPSNYLNLGFIARALPDARFIHLNRDPVDVGLSNLRTLFSHACPYSYDQQEFIAHYRLYQRLMAHWRRLLPERILDVNYQDLVDDPEASAARIAAFCGLDYEPSMVKIEARSDAVSTASSVMMREGIRKDRGQVWKAYERQLQPIIAALG